MTKDAKTPAKAEKQQSKPIVGKIDLKTGKNETLDDIIATCGRLLKEKKLKAFPEEMAKAMEIAPKDPRVLHYRGLYEFEKRNTTEAARLLRDALKIVPRSPTLQHNFAAVLISLGRFEQAENLLRTAIALKPDYAEAFHTLSPICTFKEGDPLIPQMAKGLERPDLSDVDRSFYGFALAKALDDVGEQAAAWAPLEAGNAAMPKRYDESVTHEGIEEIATLVTRERLEELSPYGHQSEAPTFIVGMPRSGTTLLESVLADHPQVHGAGELTALGAIGRAMSKNLDISDIRIGYGKAVAQTRPNHVFAAGKGYLRTLRREADDWFDRIVDKMPDNSFNLGFAAAILPRATVLHIMRHPLDVMLSIYFQRFTTVKYAFTVEDIVSHWKSYQRAMAHWRTALPRPMIELRYENLVQDKDFAQSWLWEQLGLTTQVDHATQDSPIADQRTASRYQVKQPVYQSSREKFRHYETEMAPFIEALGGMEKIEEEVAAQEARCALRAAAG